MSRESIQYGSGKSMWESVRGSRRKFVAAVASIALLPTALVACEDEEKPKPVGSELTSMLKDKYETQEVDRCRGTAVVKYNGHVRNAPFIGEDRKATLITAFEDLLPENQLVLHEPHRVRIDTSEASSIWYIEQYNDGRLAFVNQDALADNNQLICVWIASPNDKPGSIEVR